MTTNPQSLPKEETRVFSVRALRDFKQSLPITETEILYRCNRVWDAWNFGTMTRDDFEEVEVPLETSIIAQAKAEELDRIIAALMEMRYECGKEYSRNQSSVNCATLTTVNEIIKRTSPIEWKPYDPEKTKEAIEFLSNNP